MGMWSQLDEQAVPLWKRYWKRRSIKNRNALVENYHPLAEYLARQKASKLPNTIQVDEGDLLGYAVIGLIEVIDRFDPDRQTQFSTFASLRIQGAILDGLRETDWVPRLERVRQKNGTVTRVVSVSSLDEQRFMGADAASSREMPATLHEVIETHSQHERKLLMDDTDFWSGVLASCNQTERLILMLYYREGCTMKQIGKQVGLSESRISQMHSNLIKRFQARWARASDLWEKA